MSAAIFVVLFSALLGCANNNDDSRSSNASQYYTVTFDSRGGSGVASKSVQKGNTVKKPDTPVRDGYYLTGWFADPSDESTEWRFDTDRVNGDITLYAGWSLLSNEEITEMFITIDGNKLKVKLEKNASVDALVELLKQDDIAYTADDYGNFEKVGGLGHSLPTSDTYINTVAGDVILYCGNQLVLFYGNNSWSYTRIGKIEGYSVAQLRDLLGAGKGKMQVTLSIE